MRTLQELYDKQDATHQMVESLVSPQTLSPTTTVVKAGYYQATDLTTVEPDLTADHIKKDVEVFGVTGTYAGSAVVPKTGQTASYHTGDDGDLERGLAWPSPRFVDNSDGTVTDSLTGLIWTKNADLPGGGLSWDAALDYCVNMNSGPGTYGYTDWRLPNVRELQSLLDYGRHSPALTPDHPFNNVRDGNYWLSTTYVSHSSYAWYVYVYDGTVTWYNKVYAFYVWPVRGGQ
jgi:hypothetical protein